MIDSHRNSGVIITYMRISAVQNVCYHSFYTEKPKVSRAEQKAEVVSMPVSYPFVNVNFGAIRNAEKMRVLFSYGMPDMYSGKELIDPALFEKLLKSGVFSYPAKYAIPFLAAFRASFGDIQAQVFKKMEYFSRAHKDDDLQELLQGLSKDYRKKLRKKQQPIFDELTTLSERLPFKYQEAFDDLMRRADNQLNDRPIVSTFNKYNFQYRLGKIRDDVYDIMSPKTSKIVSNMIEISEGLSDIDSVETREAQKEIIYEIAAVAKAHSSLKDYPPLNQLLQSSIARLNKEPIELTFSRKAFISELDSILEKAGDEELRAEMIETAQKLPTSKDASEAYILKYKDSTPDKIAYRLAHLSYASVEHIEPRSLGGADEMCNFGPASIEENSGRGNKVFTEQIKRRPKTAESSQKVVDRLIELEKEGKFKKHDIDPRYIEDFKDSIEEQSEGQIVLNTDKLYE